jgi:PelA/Pel-15E family pectate lyase
MARFLLVAVLALSAVWPCGAAELSREDAEAALHKAVDFFRIEVSAQGGYVWRYSADLARREGEGKATPLMVWVQPPGTPTIGQAYLDLYELTGDTYYLEAAQETAHALVKGQLQSGGWDYRIEYDPKARGRYAYRTPGGKADGRNTTTLDDNTTQAALRYLMKVDRVLDFKDEAIHEAVMYALDCLLKAQYPNGAWAQRYAEFPDPAKCPVKRASYPAEWSRTFPSKDYKSYYTFNDGTLADMIRVMFLAEEVYGDAKYGASARKGGDFILLAQMPEPQPAWAQQYNVDMHPAWARKFEPPAVTGGESHSALSALMNLYRETGDEKYLEPIPRAIQYMKSSELPGKKMARFYELKTNKPLFFTKDYKLTYSSADMPTHYSFLFNARMGPMEAEYNALKKNGPPKKAAAKRKKPKMTADLAKRARAAVDGLDERGAWVHAGPLRYHGADDPTTHVIDSRTFVNHVRALGEFIAASK